MSFTLHKQDKKYVLVAKNPSPYHVSFGQIQLQSRQQNHPPQNYAIAQQMDMMVSPFSERQYQFEQQPTSLSGELTLDYIYFDDAGNQVKNSQLVKVTP